MRSFQVIFLSYSWRMKLVLSYRVLDDYTCTCYIAFTIHNINVKERNEKQLFISTIFINMKYFKLLQSFVSSTEVNFKIIL